jgi:hypothetical protein
MRPISSAAFAFEVLGTESVLSRVKGTSPKNEFILRLKARGRVEN